MERACIFLDLSLLFRETWIWNTGQLWMGGSQPPVLPRVEGGAGPGPGPGKAQDTGPLVVSVL